MRGSRSGSQPQLKLQSLNEMAHPSNRELSIFYYHISEKSRVNAPIEPRYVTWYGTASISQIKSSVDTLGQNISSLYERMIQNPSQYGLSANDFIQSTFIDEVDRQFPNDPNQGYRHKLVKESTVNDIRKIKDMDEDDTARAGYMVLGTKQIPTNQSSWYSFSKPKEVITDIGILISSQPTQRSLSYTKKKEMESTLEEFEGFENMSFVPFDRTPAQLEAEAQAAQKSEREKYNTTKTEEDEEWVDWD
ncbi:uncharacterized protein L199_007012 [Kwoniella botswanensis]|uniref:uncharacterized protein n=1 Tax=Kwoniella botswanensis TaxID=1268659 RepID=UPI00315D3A4A